MTTEFVEANGLRFAYLAEGTGPLVLLCHGFPDTAHTWDDLRPRLAARGYRVVSPFMRGYHPTAAPERDTDQETLAKDVLALITALGSERAILVGHDWGATAVYGATMMEPERVEKLFALAIPHPATLRPTLSNVWGVRHFVAYKLPGAPSRFAAHDFAALPRVLRRWSPKWNPSPSDLEDVRACFAHRASLDAAFGYYRALTFTAPAYMRKPIGVPTVVFAGLDDPNLTVDDFHRARRMFTGEYTVEPVPGGHFLHREDSETFAARLFAHL